MFGNRTEYPQPEPRILGLDQDRLPSNEVGRPIPYLAGTRPLAMTYLGQAFRVVATPVYQDAKKVQVQSGYNYQFSFVGLLCTGLLHSVTEVRIDGEVAWSGMMTFSGESIDITVPNRGTLRIYKGSETQTQDAHAALAEADVGDFHPAYRGLAYAIGIDWFIGYNNPSLPPITITCSRFPTFGWLSSSANVLADCNPVAIAADLVTHPRAGMGAAEARLNTTSLDAIAETLLSECVGLSPYLNTQTRFRELIASLNEYFDGFIKPGSGGEFDLGLQRPAAGAVPSYDETSLIEPPQIEPGDWDETLNQVYVTYTNRARDWFKDAEPGHSSGNFVVNASLKSETFERLAITRQRYAAVLAAVIASRRATPLPTGTLKVRRSLLDGLQIGGVFELNWGRYGLCHWRCRATRISRPNSRAPYVEVRFEEDRGAFNARYFTPAVEEYPDRASATAEAIEESAFMELPHLHEIGNRDTRVACLIARPNAQTTAFDVYRLTPAASYERIATLSRFGFHGTLDSGYALSTPVNDEIEIAFTLDQTDISLTNTSLPALPLASAVNDEWLAWIPASGELLSLYDATLAGAGEYTASAIRARIDTIQAAGTSADDIWLFRRRDLASMSVLLTDATASETLKIVPRAGTDALELADVSAQVITLEQRSARPWRPGNLRAFGSATPSYASGDDIPLTWDTRIELRSHGWTEWNTDLPQTEIVVMDGADEVFTTTMDAGVESLTISNVTIADAFGTEPDTLTIRAYHVRDGLRSAEYAAISIARLGSANQYVNQIPAMTSNTTPSGTVLEGDFLFGPSLFVLFDHAPLELARGFSLSSVDEASVGYIFDTGKVITAWRYTTLWTLATDLQRLSLEIEGSNDGSSWTSLGTWADQDFDRPQTFSRLFTFSNATSYTHYRVKITPGTPYWSISEIEMYL